MQSRSASHSSDVEQRLDSLSYSFDQKFAEVVKVRDIEAALAPVIHQQQDVSEALKTVQTTLKNVHWENIEAAHRSISCLHQMLNEINTPAWFAQRTKTQQVCPETVPSEQYEGISGQLRAVQEAVRALNHQSQAADGRSEEFRIQTAQVVNKIFTWLHALNSSRCEKAS